jgi:signal transduction histidine kinase
VFLPVAGFLYLDTYERQLLRSLEHALAQQARVLAASLSGRGALTPEAAAEMLGGTVGAAQGARFVEVIQREVARLEGLLVRVREIAWIDARLEEEERERLDVAEKAAGCVESLRQLALPAFRLTVPGSGASPAARPTVRLAPYRLAQVLENLLDNPAGFAPPASEVEVTVTREGPWAVLRVANRGPGIPPEHLGRIFDRFFSYRPPPGPRSGPNAGGEPPDARTADPRAEHPGLGLAIVKAVVEGYGGMVHAANREGGGIVFEVRLPAE